MNLVTLPDRPGVPGPQIAYKKLTADHPKKKLSFICMPGGPGGDHSIFASHTDFLTQFGEVILFDPRGCGLSHASGSQDYEMETYIDDVEALRRHFQIERNFILLGISYGSMAAQGYAIKYPQNLSGLILLNGAPSHEFLDSAWTKLRKEGTAAQIAMFQKLCNGEITTDEGMREYFKVMSNLYYASAKTAPAKWEAYLKTRTGSRYHAPATLAGFGKNGFLKSFDWRPHLQQITCPTLIIGGQDDWVNTPDQWKIMHQEIRNSELHIIPGASHMVFVDQKDAYFKTLANFLEKF